MKLSNNPSKSRNSIAVNEEKTCYLMLILPIVGFFLFTLYPILWSGRISFFSYDGIKSHTSFVGIENYAKLITDKYYWSSWITNIKLFIFKMPVEALLAFITANLLSNKTKFAGFYRSMYFMPAIISSAVIGLIFSNMFDYFGLINAILTKSGILKENINWFENETTSFLTIYITSFWASFGTNVLYFMAALSTVPKEVLEGADIDGANSFVKMFKIKLPMIMPTLQVLLLLSFNGVLQLNDLVLLLTNGAPGGKTYTVAAYLTSKIVPGFGQTSDVGYAAAMSIATSLIFCAVALIFNKLTKKMESVY